MIDFSNFANLDIRLGTIVKSEPAFENYTFNDKYGGTELLIEIDISDEWKDMFNDMWPKALVKLKEIAEEK